MKDPPNYFYDDNPLAAFRIRAAGVVWMCAVQFFVTQIVVQSVWTSPFSLATNFISDLGNTTCGNYPDVGGTYVCSPWHALMNVSFSLQGVIILVGAILARSVFRRERSRSLVFVLFILTGLGMIAVGLFPEDVNNNGHVIGAGVQFVTGNTALAVIGMTGRRVNLKRGWFVASTVLGLTGLAATLLFVSGYGLGLGIGGMERVAAYTFPIWLIAAGILFITKVSREAKPSD